MIIVTLMVITFTIVFHFSMTGKLVKALLPAYVTHVWVMLTRVISAILIL